jgi:hypothetical protein
MEVEISQQAGVILRAGPTSDGSTHGLIYDRNAGDYLSGGPMLMGLRVEGVFCPSDCDGNGIDDATEPDSDGDNLIDACDTCPDEPALLAPNEPGAEITCDDGIDNDCDGLTDASDSDCTAACICGDFDGSGGPIDLNDFAVFSNCFDLTSPSPSCTAEQLQCCDMNGDGTVDLNDFSSFATLFGQEVTVSPPNC